MNKENIKNHIVNIFYPRRCAVCDRALPGEACICSSCEEQTHVITGDTCFRCGKKLNSDESVYCFDCRKLPRNYERGFAIFEYEDIKITPMNTMFRIVEGVLQMTFNLNFYVKEQEVAELMQELQFTIITEAITRP